MKTIKIALTLLSIMLSTLVFSQEKEDNVHYLSNGVIEVGKYAGVTLKKNSGSVANGDKEAHQKVLKVPAYETMVVYYDSITLLKIGKFANVKIEDGIKASATFMQIEDYATLQVKDSVNVSKLRVITGQFANVVMPCLNTQKTNISAGAYSNISLSGHTTDLTINAAKFVHVNSNVEYKSLVENTDKYYTKNGYTQNESTRDKFTQNDYYDDENNHVSYSILNSISGKRRQFHSYSRFGYSFLGWSGSVGGVDDLFSGPNNQYSLKHSTRWQIDVYDFAYYFANRLYISSGIGYESNVFRFRNNVNLKDGGGDIFADNSVSSSSKLVARYITVPLIFGWNCFGKDEGLQIGVIGGVNFRTSHTGFKRQYNNGKEDVNYKSGTTYNNFKPLKADLHFGLHFGWCDVYMRYALSSMFKNNKEMDIYPYSVGISFSIGYF